MFGTPQYNQKNIKNQMVDFYKGNKVTTWLAAFSLLILLFTKTNFFDIIWPIYLCFFAGYILKFSISDKKIIYIYLGSLASGVLIYSLFFYTKFNIKELIIASIGSAAFGLLTYLISYQPNLQVQMMLVGRMKILWVGLILIGIDLLTLQKLSLPTRFPHLGGIIFGFLMVYANNLKKMFFDFKFLKWRKKGPYIKYDNRGNSRPVSDEDYNKQKRQNQVEIDKILEKIKISGYEALTAEEKRKLFEQSKR